MKIVNTQSLGISGNVIQSFYTFVKVGAVRICTKCRDLLSLTINFEFTEWKIHLTCICKEQMIPYSCTK